VERAGRRRIQRFGGQYEAAIWRDAVRSRAREERKDTSPSEEVPRSWGNASATGTQPISGRANRDIPRSTSGRSSAGAGRDGDRRL